MSSVEIRCPYCGEPTDVFVDPGGGDHQRFIEDCAVCCHPIEFQADRRGQEDAYDVSAVASQ